MILLIFPLAVCQLISERSPYTFPPSYSSHYSKIYLPHRILFIGQLNKLLNKFLELVDNYFRCFRSKFNGGGHRPRTVQMHHLQGVAARRRARFAYLIKINVLH
jgi:hypothetical protein